MNASQRFAWWLCSVCLVVSLGSARATGDDAAMPARFRDLLAPGDAVYLKSSTNTPYYSVQLLTPEQVTTIREQDARIAELTKQTADIKQTLTMEQRLERRAELMLKSEEIEREMSSLVRQSRANGDFYEVAHVGEDYVALKQGDRETFLPFSVVRSLNRGGALGESATPNPRDLADRLGRSGGFSGGRSGFSSGGFGGRYGAGESRTPEITVQLRNLKAAEVAEAIAKLFKEEEASIRVDESNNVLIVQMDRARASTALRLIQRLDANPE